MNSLFQIETITLELLLVISLVAIAVQRLRLPYTVALVVVGLAIGALNPLNLEQFIEDTPELILALFLPPLVFEAAFHLDYDELKKNLPPILMMAIPGVLVTMLIVGAIVTVATPLRFEVALVFGALIAATDPVAIIALFRSLGVPKRLAVMVEGESLLNDGAAIVLFSLMLEVALTGTFDLTAGVLDFVRVAVGGIALGIGFGGIIAWIIARVDDHLIEITLTTVLVFGSYLLAEELHFSGVLAVVAAGLLNGNASSEGMSPTTRIILNHFWEYIAFLANSFVFLLIGLDINIPILLDDWQAIIIAVIAVLVARVIVVYGFSVLSQQFSEPVPMRWRHILAWGGLRGAIGLALVLTLPATLGEDRELLRAMTFGVVLFTLFIQGTTIQALLQRLGIIERSEAQIEYELRHARLTALQAANNQLDELRNDGLIADYTWNEMKPKLSNEIDKLSREVHDLLEQDPHLAAEDLQVARAAMLRTQRSTLLELRRTGVISDESFEKLVVEIDESLDEIEAH